MRIIVKGAYGTRNFGDDLLMLVVYNIFIDICLQIDFLCPDHKYIKKIEPNISLNSDGSSKSYDLCLYGGGTQFYSFVDQNVGGNSKLKKLISNLLSPARLYNTLQRRLNGEVGAKQDAYIGVGIGPFYNKMKEDEVLSKISRSNFIALRDEKSISYMSNYTDSFIVGADLCFSSHFNSYLLQDITEIEKKWDVGIVLRDWNQSKKGIVSENNIKSLIDRLVCENKTYTFIFFSSIHDAKWIKLCKKYKFNYSVWNPDIQSVSEFLSLYSRCSSIVSSRYHGLVLSSLLNIPFVSMVIEPKLESFASKFPRFSAVNYPFDSNDIFSGVEDNVWSHEDSIVVEKEKIKADYMVSEFQEFVKGLSND